MMRCYFFLWYADDFARAQLRATPPNCGANTSSKYNSTPPGVSRFPPSSLSIFYVELADVMRRSDAMFPQPVRTTAAATVPTSATHSICGVDVHRPPLPHFVRSVGCLVLFPLILACLGFLFRLAPFVYRPV